MWRVEVGLRWDTSASFQTARLLRFALCLAVRNDLQLPTAPYRAGLLHTPFGIRLALEVHMCMVCEVLHLREK